MDLSKRPMVSAAGDPSSRWPHDVAQATHSPGSGWLAAPGRVAISAGRLPLALTLLIFMLAFLLPASPWLSGRLTIPWDAKSQFFPQVQFLASSLARGEWPWWSPNVFAGWAQDFRSAVALVLSAPCIAGGRQRRGQPARLRCRDFRLFAPRRLRHHPVLPRSRLASGRCAGRRDGVRARRRGQRAHSTYRPDHQPGVSAACAVALGARA